MIGRTDSRQVTAGSGVASVDVVAVVASAGGVGALLAVSRAPPADCGAAVVVAQHLGGQSSKLVDILRRQIALRVD